MAEDPNQADTHEQHMLVHVQATRKLLDSWLHRKLRTKVKTLYRAIAHGDKKHRAWLKAKIDRHFKGLLED